MSNYNIHSYEHDPSFYGCAEPDKYFHACDKAFYSPPLNWDTFPTIPYFDMDETSADYTDVTGEWAEQYHTSEYPGLSTNKYTESPEIDADKGYTNATNFYVENYNTGLDAEYQEGSQYADKLQTSLDAGKTYYNSANTQHYRRTPRTDTFNLNKENYYEEQQNDSSPLVVMTLLELGPQVEANTHNNSPTLPYVWWHDLGLDDETYEEWEKDDPD
ncbi:hypothetical protein K439DRAFT_1615789 [Ramaria rubella]|nr:hypothetical protein K439DRAFT_1615789 [Ramaria rubella]